MLTDIGLLVARLMLSLVFVWSAMDKTMNWSAGLSEITTAGLDYAPYLLAATVAVQFAGGLSVALGILARLGGLALAGFTIVATLMFHAFWFAADSTGYQRELTTFLEHVAIVGGLLTIIFIGPGALSIDQHLDLKLTRGPRPQRID